MFAPNLSASNRKEINFRSKGKGALHKTLCAAFIVATVSTGFSLGPAQASGTYNGTDGTVLCSTSGSFTVLANAVTGHTSCSGIAVVPASVTSIDQNSFFYATALTSFSVHPDNPNYSSFGGVVFNKNQTSLIQFPLGNAATDYSSIPATVTSINPGAFRLTALTSVTIPESVTSIGEAAFGGASLTSVVFSGTSRLATISAYAFEGVPRLQSITIPASVTSIGEQAFGNSGLTSITVESSNANYSSLEGVLFNKTKTSLIQYPIGNAATAYSSIPANVTSIGANAFSGSANLASVTIPESVTSIGAMAFYSATGLTSITIPASVASIGAQAFQRSGISSIAFSGTSTLASIDALTFNLATALTSITIPASVTSIAATAFHEMPALTSITVESSNANYSSLAGVLFNKTKTSLIQYPIGNLAASYSSIPASVTSIGANAFMGATKLTSVTIPATVTSIGGFAFQSTPLLTSVIFSDTSSIETIGEYAFSISGFTSFTIPASVTTIGDGAFWRSAKSLYFLGNAPSTVHAAAFTGVGSDGKAYRKTGATGFGATGSMWNGPTHGLTVAVLDDGERACTTGTYTIIDFVVTQGLSCAGVAAIAEGVRAIGDSSHSPFSGADALTSITIPASVTSIGNSAFQQTSALTSFSVDPANANFSSEDGVLFNKTKSSLLLFPAARGNAAYVVPTSVVTIGAQAFEFDRSLTSITISENVESIGNFAFRDANKLTSVTFSGTSRLASFGRMSFKQTKLETIIIPASVTVIGDETFAFAPLRTITFDENSLLTTIGEYGFYEASALASITIPASVTDIEDGVFWGARALANVVFLGNAPSVGANAFFDVAAGARATVSASATGFPAVGGTWNGLTVQSSSAPAETPPPPAATPPAATPPAATPPAATPPAATPVATTPPAVDSAAQAAAADLASRTVSARAKFASNSLANRVGVKMVSSKAKVTFTVASSSRKICVKSGTSLRTLKAGTCRVTFTVQEPKPKKSKALKPKRTTKILVVQ